MNIDLGRDLGHSQGYCYEQTLAEVCMGSVLQNFTWFAFKCDGIRPTTHQKHTHMYYTK